MSELSDEQVKALLRKEYPYLFAPDIDRLAKTCRSEKWFIELVKKRLSKDLQNVPKQIIVKPNAGGEAEKNKKPLMAESSTPEKYYDDPDPESLKPDRDIEIKILEYSMKMLLDCRSDRVRHMRASINFALLNNNLNLREIADHFGVTTERVTQVANDVKGYIISARQL